MKRNHWWGAGATLLCPAMLMATPTRVPLKEQIKREVLAELHAEAPPLPAEKKKEGLWIGDKVRITGQVRVRPEVRNDLTRANAPTTKQTDISVALRSRIGVQATPAPHVGLFVQVQDSRYFGESANTTTDAHFVDLHQGYIDLTNIGNVPFSIRAGRQEITLGDGRLIGSPDWSNVGRAFDAVVMSYQPEAFGVLGFGAITDRTATNAGAGQYAGGLYGSWKKFPGGVWDGYYLFVNDSDAAAGATAGTGTQYTVHTVGTRIAAEYGNGLDVNAEAAVQFGKFGSNTLMAYAGHATSGYTIDHDWKPRFGLEYNYATGDDAGNTKYTKFQTLLPANHNKYGMMDIATWTNVHDAAVHFGVKPGVWQAQLSYHVLAVDKPTSTSDAFAGVAGAAGNGRIAGHEIDIQAKWKMNANCEFGAGVGHFMPGAYLKNAGQTHSSEFGYLTAQVQF